MKKLRSFILSFALVSCLPSSETTFNRSGVSFTCPEGWKITEEEAIDPDGYHLVCEKSGLTSSGMLSISWLRDSVHLGEMLDVYKKDMTHNILHKNSNLTFSETVTDTFNIHPATAVRFSMSMLSLQYEGTIYCFHANGKTVTILKQESADDKSKNKGGFEVIEKSFLVAPEPEDIGIHHTGTAVTGKL